MSEWIKTAITILLAFVGSAGFWGFLEARRKKNDANTRLLVGMAHDRIVYLGMKYIERGYITRDEYENLNDYLYEPYAVLAEMALQRELWRKYANYRCIIKEENNILMENKVYDVLKFLALVVLPALATFYAAIAAVWGLPYTEQVVGTITAVDTLLGTLLKISSDNYKKQED